tara:strand:+ start:86 stop:442 length:357 start_codon:yes stop_codon:yes gene_type:complete
MLRVPNILGIIAKPMLGLFPYHYKNHFSSFKDWTQKEHTEDRLIYGKNIGKYLSLYETSLPNGELYAILTNKHANGKKGSIVAILIGAKALDVINVLHKTPIDRRNMGKGVTYIWQVI